MTFFYDLNKRLAALASKQDAEQLSENAKASAPKSQLAEAVDVAEAGYSAKAGRAGKDLGKPGKTFAKIAKSAGKEYGSKAAGERVAGAVLNKLRAKESVAEGQMKQAMHKDAERMSLDKFVAKYGDEGWVRDFYNNTVGPVDETASKALTLVRNNLAPYAEEIADIIDQGRMAVLDDNFLDNPNDIDQYAKHLLTMSNLFRRNPIKGLKYLGTLWSEIQEMTIGEVRDRLNIDLGQMYNRAFPNTGRSFEEGNAFTAALAKTPKGGKFKVGNKEFTDTSDLEEGFADMNAWLASREKEKGTGRFDKRERTLPSGMKATTYTRKPETFDDPDPETDPEATGGAPKRRGRPKGKDKGPERVTAKSYKYKAGRPAKTAEDLDADGVMMTRPSNMSSEGVDHGEYDREGDMAKEQMHTIMSAAKELHSILRDEENLPEWVQKKITLAKEYIDTARDYMLTQHAERAEEQPIAEKAVSVAQRRAAGIAHAAQKGEIPKKELRGASKEMAKMPKGELKKFAKTKETDLPKKIKKADEGKGDGNLANNAKPYDKVTQGDVVAGRLGKDEMGGKKKKEDKVDETTVAGSVATAPAAAKKSAGGYNFGGGVYEGFNNRVESMITEGMNISVNMNAGEDGQTRKSITVSAEGAEADQLAALLKMAGLHGQSSESCGTCGQAPCGCEQTVDEAYGDTDETLNDPDWPTNTETLAAEPNLRTYSGGLNGPKSTGQTTVPVVASQLRRQVSMEESAELERSLFKTWKNYKG
jgi:hypothetical protein